LQIRAFKKFELHFGVQKQDMYLLKRIRCIAIVLLFAGGIFLSGQAQQESYKLLVSTDWLTENLSDSTLVLLHYGMKSAFREEHIPGARYVDIWNFLAENDQGIRNELPDKAALEKELRSLGINTNSRIVICYQDVNALPRAARLFFTLDYAGLSGRISLLQGGLKAWKEENKPLTGRIDDIEPGNVDIKINELVRASKENVMSGLQKGNVTLVDARPQERFYGSEEDQNSSRQGHITGAINFPYYDLTRDELPHLFKEDDEIQELMEDRNIQQDQRIIVYCGTGIWASSLYFAARHLGYDVQMYDASFQEWGNDSTLPVSLRSAGSSDF
jgi:thiosulfate/3-mercaptopyruvate sulfurtransferase